MTPRKLVLVCPGQGRFNLTTLSGLHRYARYKPINAILDRADTCLPEVQLSSYIRHPEAISSHDTKLLQTTKIQQPMLILTSYLKNEIAKMDGMDLMSRADYMIGHSLGEISCLVLQNAITLEKGLQIGYKRGEMMQKFVDSQHSKYGMYAVVFKSQYYKTIVDELTKLDVNIANYNTYSQVVVSGEKRDLDDKMDQVRKQMIGRGIRFRTVDLHVSIPFHNPLLRQLEGELHRAFSKLGGDLAVPMISNLDGQVERDLAGEINKIIGVTSRPVQFSKCLERFIGGGPVDFVHYGQVTKGLVGRYFGDVTKLGRHGVPELTNTLAGVTKH